MSLSALHKRVSRSFVAESLEPRRLLTAITSGERIVGSISPVGEIDSYEFALSANDRFSVVVADTAGGTFFSPELEVFAPGGASLGVVSNATGMGLDLVGPVGGTYTATVHDNNNDTAGDYAFSMVRAPGTQLVDSDSHPISTGQGLIGTIDLGDLDVYTFHANASDQVTLLVGDTAGGTFFGPRLTLYAPDGSIVADATGSTSVSINAPTLTQSGTYTVVIRDSGYDSNGLYRLSMVRVPDTQPIDADSGPIAPGGREYGTIDLGDLDVYTFTASADGSFVLNVVDLDGSSFFGPDVRVYAPSGQLITSSNGGTTASLNAASLVQSGTYTVVVRDGADDVSGHYAITLAQWPIALPAESDGDGGAISSGQSITASLSLGDLDLYSIPLTAGNSTTFRMAELGSGSFSVPKLDLYGPDGLLVDSANDGSEAVLTTVAPVSGTYYLLARDSADDSIFKYALAVDTAASQTDTRPPQVTDFDFNYLQAAHRATLTLNESLGSSFVESDLIVRDLAIGNLPTSDYVAAFDDTSNRITVDFNAYANGTLPDGNYRITLRGGFVSDTAGNALPSNAVFDFFFLTGDANHDRVVDISDLGTLATNWQEVGRTYAQGNFNYSADGAVDISDLGILATSWQNTVPVPVAPAAPTAFSRTVIPMHTRAIDLVEAAPAELL